MNTFPVFPWPLSLLGKSGQAQCAQIQDPHTRAGEMPLAGSPDSFPMHKEPFSAKAVWWFFLEWQLFPSPSRLGTIFWQAYVLKSYRWCRHSLEGIPAGPPPRSLLITHQITLAACRIPGLLAAPGNQLQGQQELLKG